MCLDVMCVEGGFSQIWSQLNFNKIDTNPWNFYPENLVIQHQLNFYATKIWNHTGMATVAIIVNGHGLGIDMHLGN